MNWNSEKDIIALMVGHGTQTNGVWDCGCTYKGYTEADLMLPIVKAAVAELRRCGVRVITDADTKNDKNIIACVAQANSTKGVKLYMSVHCDYAGSKIKGVAPLYVSAQGKAMALSVGKYIAKAMGMNWAGAYKRTNLYELNATKMPAVILETGCIKSDLNYLKKSEEYGMALANGLLKFIGVSKKPKASTKKKHSNAWRLRKSAKAITKYMDKHDFKYKASWKDNALSWEGAKKKKTTNCSNMVSYALQRAGFIDKGIFWGNGKKIVCKGGLTLKDLKRIGKIMHPNKPPKKAHLRKGDICMYGGEGQNAHTMIFEEFNSKGIPTWYSTGSTSEIQKGGAHVKKTYTNREIPTILRLK